MTNQHLAPQDGAFNQLARRSLLAGIGIMASHRLSSPPGVDANFIALCSQHLLNMDAVNSDDAITDDDPKWAPYFSTSDALTGWKPRTLEGLIAKAQLVKAEATHLDGEVVLEAMSMDWAWDVLDGLIAIGGRA